MTKRHPTTWILVCDGARGRVYSHEGPGSGLIVVSSAEHPETHGYTRDLGSDRPGRTFDSTETGGRHALSPRADWHNFEKTRFAAQMAAVVEKAAAAKSFDRLVVVAPPRVLGDLRQALGTHSQALLAGELDKDLTHFEGAELIGHLGQWVKP